MRERNLSDVPTVGSGIGSSLRRMLWKGEPNAVGDRVMRLVDLARQMTKGSSNPTDQEDRRVAAVLDFIGQELLDSNSPEGLALQSPKLRASREVVHTHVRSLRCERCFDNSPG